MLNQAAFVIQNLQLISGLFKNTIYHYPNFMKKLKILCKQINLITDNNITLSRECSTNRHITKNQSIQLEFKMLILDNNTIRQVQALI